MSALLRNYVTAKAHLLAVILDEQWAKNNHAVEEAHADFVNAAFDLRTR